MLYPIQNHVRNRLDLSGIWDFRTDPDEIGEREGWPHGLSEARPIAVPGSWNEQYEDLYDYLGLSWYVKRTFVPTSWQGQRIFIRVGSACYTGTVYVNGVKTGAHQGGHLPFAFEITGLVRWGEENVIAISVENRLEPTRVPAGNMSSPLGGIASYPPTTFDFYPFAGLHRPVVLYATPPIHIEDITVVTGFDAAEPGSAGDRVDGHVRVTVRLSAAVAAQGTVALQDANAVVRGEIAFREGLGEVMLAVPGARLWSDRDPHLYTLTVQTEQDCYSLAVGIRTVAVQDGQIVLNGKPVKLNGFGRHEDFVASGKGVNLPLLVKDFQLMRWTGANSYRTSHYPYCEEDLDMADREGFLVIDETPAVSLQFESEENAAVRLRMCLQQTDELVARDKNHPSVVMWCVANEPLPANLRLQSRGTTQEDASVQRGKRFLDALLDRAHALDPTRPATLAMVMGGPEAWMERCDVICMNRYWGWYVLGGELNKAFLALSQELDAVWERWRKPIVLTEFGADTMAGLHGQPAVMWTEEYQAELIRGYLEVAAGKPFVAGMQVWNFADFAAVQSPMRVGGLNMKGVFTRLRAPKMAAHVLREHWKRT